jgi:Tol biopolymer transport system component
VSVGTAVTQFVRRPQFVAAVGATALIAGSPAPGAAGPLRERHGGSTSNIYILDVSKKSSLRLLTHNPQGDEDALAYSPALSPDGKRLAFAETRCHFCPSLIRVAKFGASAWLGRVVAPGSRPTWTPDGRRLTYIRPDGSIAVTGQALAKPRVLVRGGLANDTPTWNRQGTRLAFARQLTATNWQIFAVRSDGSGMRALTHGPQPALDPAWAPDGKRLAYARQTSDLRWQICVATLTDGKHRCIMNARFSDTEPAWSPDGKWIAFVRQKPYGSVIWMMHPNGSGARRIAPPWPYALTVLQPHWTRKPDVLLFAGRV